MDFFLQSILSYLCMRKIWCLRLIISSEIHAFKGQLIWRIKIIDIILEIIVFCNNLLISFVTKEIFFFFVFFSFRYNKGIYILRCFVAFFLYFIHFYPVDASIWNATLSPQLLASWGVLFPLNTFSPSALWYLN